MPWSKAKGRLGTYENEVGRLHLDGRSRGKQNLPTSSVLVELEQLALHTIMLRRSLEAVDPHRGALVQLILWRLVDKLLDNAHYRGGFFTHAGSV